MTPSDCIDHGKKGTYYSAYCKRLGKNIGLHRQVLAEKLGINVEDMDGVAMHLCDNKRCINPDHLVLGTQSENILSAHSNGLVPRNQPTNSLSEDLRVLIRESDLGTRELARSLGIHHSTVSRIRNGKSK